MMNGILVWTACGLGLLSATFDRQEAREATGSDEDTRKKKTLTERFFMELNCLEGDKVINVTYNITVKDSAQVAVGNNGRIVNNYCGSDKQEGKVVCSTQVFTEKLKSSIKKQTDFQPRLRKDKRTKTDDIFTSLTIHRIATKDQLQGTQHSAPIGKCSDIFRFPQDETSCTAMTNGFPKAILTVGKPGIGKTFFCQKLVRDWAHDLLFPREDSHLPDLQFCYLLTFRQLSLLGGENLSLREILNRSSTLDEQSVIDEGMFECIMQHPENLLIIIDGYDEYHHHDNITGDYETKYPNDPRQKMPIAAMISKLLKGKILQECVFMVTSRPEEAEGLLDASKFEKSKVEIIGYSSQQVVEYVKRFFKDDDVVMSAVLELIKTNGILLSFAQIPVVCFLMCCLLEWHVTGSETPQDLPITMTDLYQQVITMFIKNHHSRLKYSRSSEHDARGILEKLAELAVSLSNEERVIFDEDDLRKMNFSEEEMTNLKECGLLDCCFGVRTSPFDDLPLHYLFTHLTMQEFLVAHWFITNKQTPENGGKTSDVTYQFMAGLLSKTKDEKLMAEVLECVKPINNPYDPNLVLTLKCLLEYQDTDLAKQTISSLFDKYCNAHGICVFYELTDVDCVAVSFLLDVISLLREEQTSPQDPFKLTAFGLVNSYLTPFGVKQLCSSLSSHRSMFRLQFWNCELDDECLKIIWAMLSTSSVTHLYLPSNQITDEGVRYISSVIRESKRFPEFLNLSNNRITEECQDDLRSLVKQHYPEAELSLHIGTRRKR